MSFNLVELDFLCYIWTMGVKDITEKNLEELDDVFADIINVLLCGGRQVILQEHLEAENQLLQKWWFVVIFVTIIKL